MTPRSLVWAAGVGITDAEAKRKNGLGKTIHPGGDTLTWGHCWALHRKVPIPVPGSGLCLCCLLPPREPLPAQGAAFRLSVGPLPLSSFSLSTG